MLKTDTFDLGLQPLIGKRREIWPQMMLNLVVCEAMQKVTHVATGRIVYTAQNLTDVKLRPISDATLEAMHIISSMIWHNQKECIDIVD